MKDYKTKMKENHAWLHSSYPPSLSEPFHQIYMTENQIYMYPRPVPLVLYLAEPTWFLHGFYLQ